jgi:peroxiredoxin Q/BCP
MLLSVGDQAPKFKLKNQEGNLVSLDLLKGKIVILWFYPKASTPG